MPPSCVSSPAPKPIVKLGPPAIPFNHAQAMLPSQSLWPPPLAKPCTWGPKLCIAWPLVCTAQRKLFMFFQMLLHASFCVLSRAFAGVCKYLQAFALLQAFTGIYWHFLAFTGICWHLLAIVGIHNYLHDGMLLSWNRSKTGLVVIVRVIQG